MKRLALRITILGLNYTPEPTGNAPYTASLAEGLAASGHLVHVVTGYPHYPEWKLADGYTGWTRAETLNGVAVRRLRHFVPRKPTTLPRFLMELSFGLRLLFAPWGKPDLILVVSPALFSSGLAILRCRLSPRRPRVCLWVQDIYSRGVVETKSGAGKLAGPVTSIESWILRSADHVVAIHERFQQFITKVLRVNPEAVTVIRNWTHLPAAPESGQHEFRKKMGWASEDVVVLHAGNMGRKQGLENVVAAARLAEKRGSDVRFVLMGDGNQRQLLEDLAGTMKRLDFVDPLPSEEFQLALSAADILLVNELPGVTDMAVPSKLTSYFNAGVPVIAATDAGSVTASEIAASGGGIRVDAADPDALLEAAEALSRDDALKYQLAISGLRFRHETLAKTSAIGKYDELVSSLASSRSH